MSSNARINRLRVGLPEGALTQPPNDSDESRKLARLTSSRTKQNNTFMNAVPLLPPSVPSTLTKGALEISGLGHPSCIVCHRSHLDCRSEQERSTKSTV